MIAQAQTEQEFIDKLTKLVAEFDSPETKADLEVNCDGELELFVPSLVDKSGNLVRTGAVINLGRYPTR